MAAFSLAKATANDDDWMLEEQRQLLATLEATLAAVRGELCRSKEDSSNCESKTKELSGRVEEQQELKNRLEEKAAVARANLKLLREKNNTVLAI